MFSPHLAAAVAADCTVVPSFTFDGQAYVRAGLCDDTKYPCTPLVVDGVTFDFELIGTSLERGVKHARDACKVEYEQAENV